MKLVITFVLLSASAFAQVPRPCVSPTKWEGHFSQVDKDKQFQVFGILNYDETVPRVRVVERVDVTKQREAWDILYLYAEGKEYHLNLQTKKCNVTGIQNPFRPIGIPPTSQFIHENEVGLASIPNESLTIITFMGNTTTDRYFGTVTSPNCIPITDGYYSEKTGYIETDFYDITPGIADPSVFVPPSECL